MCMNATALSVFWWNQQEFLQTFGVPFPETPEQWRSIRTTIHETINDARKKKENLQQNLKENCDNPFKAIEIIFFLAPLLDAIDDYEIKIGLAQLAGFFDCVVPTT